jgi:hypothetical protein
MAPGGPDPYARAADGSALDPAAFQAALRADPEKLAALEADPVLRDVLLGSDVPAMQALLQQAHQARRGGAWRCAALRGRWPQPCTPQLRSSTQHAARGRSCWQSCRACLPQNLCIASWSVHAIQAMHSPHPPAPHHPAPGCPRNACVQAQQAQAKDAGRWMAERSVDAQRASATVCGYRGSVLGLRPFPGLAQATPLMSCLSPSHVIGRLPGGRLLAKTRGINDATQCTGALSSKTCQVPRDTAQLYAQLAASGLQYGPAFRLLRNVHVPDTSSS